MKTFYVATLARYVLVDAADETEAASLGQEALHALYADLRAKHGRDIPIGYQQELTSWIGSADPCAREKHEGKGKGDDGYPDGYWADDEGHSLLGLNIVATRKVESKGRARNGFWLTDVGRERLAKDPACT
ncbi:hypothetical protein CA13_62430 [Planctomycetes bacterium CA13]|uniref:Uncharacterized protein n=1 Tax=Novipirellula herctigrandis TaxID=2527986 RepID=A0A5C5ZE08_9BACT|nr:hypothetical protein CA13_62430 [Planctomycetes bacterium CA13]